MLNPEKGAYSFKNVVTFNMDEYVGLPTAHPQSYRSVIRDEFAALVDIDPTAIDGPDGEAEDVPAESARYDRAIAEAGGRAEALASDLLEDNAPQ